MRRGMFCKSLTIVISWCSLSMVLSSNKVSNVKPGETIDVFETSISFDGMLDSSVVHSHHEKMKWSKARHSELYDPTLDDPFQYMDQEVEEADMKMRPTLAYTLMQRLSNDVFVSLISKLPTDDARNVMDWKNVDALRDLDPHCEVNANNEGSQE